MADGSHRALWGSDELRDIEQVMRDLLALGGPKPNGIDASADHDEPVTEIDLESLPPEIAGTNR